jgi:hypothetical protein
MAQRSRSALASPQTPPATLSTTPPFSAEHEFSKRANELRWPQAETDDEVPPIELTNRRPNFGH